jgi:hypothetical protein
VRSAQAVIKAESIAARLVIVMDVIDLILNQQRVRITGKLDFQQPVNRVTK